MTELNIEQKLKDILENSFEIKRKDILSEKRFVEDFLMDSLDILQYSIEIEKELQIETDYDKISSIETFKEGVDYITSLIDNQKTY